jgi:hypothetical protein
LSTSPCIDAGNNADVYSTQDLDGHARIVSWSVDMGAYESEFGRIPLPGDLNCDGHVSYADINPFVLALSNAANYHATFPDCNILNADINADGVVSYADINPFVTLLSQP